MNLVTLPLAEIKPYWRNPRDNAEAVEAVMQSITDYGYNRPIAVDREHVIVVGDTRYRALQRLGQTEAKVVVLDLPPEKAKAYRIADNVDLSTWDYAKLIPELREIGDVAEMQIYFPDEDLTELLGEAAGEGGEVEQGDLDRAAGAQAGQFEHIETNATAGMVEVLCTHCGEKSYVSRDDVLRRTEPAET